MMKYLLAACLVANSVAALADEPEKACIKLAPTTKVSAPIQAVEIERQELAKMSRESGGQGNVPKLPFGYMNREWVAFKSAEQPGDEIVAYETDEASWKRLAGQAGYALIRSGCVVRKLKTVVN